MMPGLQKEDINVMYIYVHINTYIHTYIHRYIYISLCVCVCSNKSSKSCGKRKRGRRNDLQMNMPGLFSLMDDIVMPKQIYAEL